MVRRVPYLIFSLVALILLVLVVKHIVDNPKTNQWDLRVYYSAVKAQEMGHNPYDNRIIEAIAGEPIPKYIYTPLALNFFRLFTLFDFDRAYYAYLFLKIFLFLFTVLLWRKTFVEHLGPFYYLFCVLSFKGALIIDLRSGNVSVFELFSVSTAIFFYLRQRYILFSVLICAAAVFKLTPALLLLLLLFTKSKNRYLYLIVSSGLFIAIQGVFFFRDANATRDFIPNLLASEERGFLNPALLPIMKDVAAFIYGHYPLIGPDTLGYALYGIAVVAILGISAIGIAKTTRASRRQMDSLFVPMFALSLYLVIMPRVKDYTYLLAVLPTLYVITHYAKRNASVFLCLIFIIADDYLIPFLTDFTFGAFWPYYQYFLAFVAWSMYVVLMFEPQTAEEDEPIQAWSYPSASLATSNASLDDPRLSAASNRESPRP